MLVDGRCALAGFDPLALPARRLIAVLYCMLVDQPTFDDKSESRRQEIIRMLEWPDKAAEMELEEADKQSRLALAGLGIGIQNLLPPGFELVNE